MHRHYLWIDLFDARPQITGVSSTLFIKSLEICDERLKTFDDSDCDNSIDGILLT
jgi:hypothetical protein